MKFHVTIEERQGESSLVALIECPSCGEESGAEITGADLDSLWQGTPCEAKIKVTTPACECFPIEAFATQPEKEMKLVSKEELRMLDEGVICPVCRTWYARILKRPGELCGDRAARWTYPYVIPDPCPGRLIPDDSAAT